ncbi:hypothetical protein [Listeria newyorkensis]|uniref:Uncharacterized protein n=1 Tax=Listeria newyorkensis TaxID=1497681 RepID=A0A841Z0I9_9LIST|nr:hypothetical protein [Listeria newyorkensis]MBC1459125.1 hypothetical protein [Listeria newyorkensis]
MIVLYSLIALYVFFFIKSIGTYFIRVKKLNFIINKFNDVRKKFPERQISSNEPYYNPYKQNEEIAHIIIKNLFDDMPLISDLLPYDFYTGSFSLNDDAESVIKKFTTYYDLLASEYSSLQYKKLSYFSLIKPIKEIFLIPSKILSWFGLTLGTISARIFSLLTIVCVGVFNRYISKSIDWIISLIS